MESQNYPLQNPLVHALNKERKDFNREDVLSAIEQFGIERITFHYTALDGKLKELRIPVASRKQAERVLADGERVDGSSLFKGLVDASLSDLYVVPVYRSAFLNPFDEGSLDFVCRFLTREGDIAQFTPDSILMKAAALFRNTAQAELHTLGELEFFLLSEPDTRIFSGSRQRGYHASAPFVKTGKILDEMVRCIARTTGDVKYAHSEVGFVESVRSDLEEIHGKQAEQLEIEFLPAPVEDMGDHLVVARWLIRNIAYRHGCVATFTPKLEEGVAGSGLHVHMEVRKDGQNVMTDAGGNLSSAARMLIGGLCTYADSLTAFGNTTSSAYLRLVPNQEAPTRICWSDMNRSAMIRVPLGWRGMQDLSRKVNSIRDGESTKEAGRQTVELRSPDGSAIVHLLLAGITMAAEWGARCRDALGVADRLYVAGNVFEDDALLRSLPSLPGSCVDSAAILKEKRMLYEREGVFPVSMIDYVARMLRVEDDKDMNQRLADLPADGRLHETRKIMHKDLHRH